MSAQLQPGGLPVENLSSGMESPDLGVVMGGKRERRRRDSLKIDRLKIADRVCTFYREDIVNTQDEFQNRVQRYAKYRMWSEPKDWPWEGASSIGLPDIFQACTRMHDTLHNAVMQSRPVVTSTASQAGFQAKQSTIDNLIDFQVFEEQRGELAIANLIENFVNEGFFTACVPWVVEEGEATTVTIFPPIPDALLATEYFDKILAAEFPTFLAFPKNSGWDWVLEEKDGGEKRSVAFYTREKGEIELELTMQAEVFKGPKLFVKQPEEVLAPPRAENLDPPGPSNPKGATHVLLEDHPTIDELFRLEASGYYDAIAQEDRDKLLVQVGIPVLNELAKRQKDIMQGSSTFIENSAGANRNTATETVTRLICFDSFDIDNDGIVEDLIFWVVLETKLVLKVAPLHKFFPSVKRKRPFAEAQFLAVPGRRKGFGLIECMESMHDFMKKTFDQMVDGGDIRNNPFFFYRAAGGMKPDVIRLWPGEGYPVADPQKDVYFPNLANNVQTEQVNAIGLGQQFQEKTSMIGDMQLGRVPTGKASALRTSQNMQSILQQGEARPERILRRFFIGLCDIWSLFHTHNRANIDKAKQYRICGFVEPGADPYKTADPEDLNADYDFTFSANALNTSREAMQQALQALGQVYFTPLTMQSGIVEPAGLYRYLMDYGKAWGQENNARSYLKPPTPDANLAPISAEDAIGQILAGQMPVGAPVEGYQGQLKLLMQFHDSDQLGLLTPDTLPIFKQYITAIMTGAKNEVQQQAMAQAAAAHQQSAQGNAGSQGGAPPQGPPQGAGQQKPLQQGQVADKSLPAAGSGASTGA